MYYPPPTFTAPAGSEPGSYPTPACGVPRRRMVDRVYRTNLPSLRKSLLNMRREFSALDTSTDWVRLRVDPLLAHIDQLRAMIGIWDSSRHRGAVPLLHADLVYFRKNVRGLRRVLAVERRLSPNKRRVR